MPWSCYPKCGHSRPMTLCPQMWSFPCLDPMALSVVMLIPWPCVPAVSTTWLTCVCPTRRRFPRPRSSSVTWCCTVRTLTSSSRPGECCQCPPTGHCSGLIKTRWVLSVYTHWSLQWSHQDQVSSVSVHPLVIAVVSSRPGESCQCPPTGHCSGLIKTRWVLSVSTHWSLQWSHQDQVSAVSVHPLVTAVVSSRPGESCQCPPTGHCSGLIKTRWVLSVSTHWSLQWSHQDQVSPVSVHPLVTAVVSSRPGESCQCPPTGHCSGLIKTRWVLSVYTHWSLQWSHQDRWVLSVSTHWSLQWSHQDQVSPVSVHPLVTAVVSSRPGESCQCPPTGHCSGLKTRWVLSVSTHWSLQWSHQDQVSAVSVHPLVTAVVSSRPGECCQCPPTGHCSGLIKTRWVLSVSTHWSLQWSHQDQVSPVSVHPLVTAVVSRPGECCQCPPTGHCSGLIKTRWILSVSTHWSLQWSHQDQVSPVSVHPVVTAVVSSRPGESCQCPPTGHCSGLIKTRWILSVSTHWSLQWSHQDQVSAVSVHPLVTAVVSSRPGECCQCPPTGHCSGLIKTRWVLSVSTHWSLQWSQDQVSAVSVHPLVTAVVSSRPGESCQCPPTGHCSGLIKTRWVLSVSTQWSLQWSHQDQVSAVSVHPLVTAVVSSRPGESCQCPPTGHCSGLIKTRWVLSVSTHWSLQWSHQDQVSPVSVHPLVTAVVSSRPGESCQCPPTGHCSGLIKTRWVLSVSTHWSLQWSHQDQVSPVSVHPLVTAVVSSRPGESCQCPPTGHCSGLIKTRWVLSVSTHWSLQWSHQDQVSAVSVHPLVTAVVSSRPGESCQCPPTGHCSGLIKTRWVLSVSTHWSLQWSHQDQVSPVSVHPLVTAVVSSRPGESCQCPPTGHCSGLIKTRWVLSVSTHWSLQWSHQDQVSAVSVHPLDTPVVSSRPGESCQCPPTGHSSGLIKTRWVLSVSTHWTLQWSHQDQVSAVSVHPLVTAVVSSRPGECCQGPPTGHCSGLIKTRWVLSGSTHWSLQWSHQDQVSPVSVHPLVTAVVIKTRWVLSVSTHWSLQWSHQDQVSPVSVHPLVTAVVSSRPGESCQCPPTGHCSGLIKTRWVLSVSTHWSLQWSHQDQVSPVSVHPLVTAVVSSRPGESCQCPPTGHCSGLIKTRWVLSVSTHWSLQWSHQDQVSPVSVHPLVTAVVSSRPGESCQCPPTGHCSGLIKTRWVLSVSTHWSLQWSHQDQVSAVSVHPLVTAVVSSRPGESCQCPPTGHCSGLIKTRWVLSVSTHWSLQWSHQDQVSPVSVHPLVTAVVSSRPGESCQCPPTGHCSGLIKTRWVLSVSTHWSLQWSHQDQVSAVSVHPLVTAVVSSRPGESCQCPPTGHCSGLIKTRWVLSVSTHWSLQWSHQDQVSPVSVHPLVTAVVSSRPGESCQCPPTGHCSGLIKTRWVLSVSTHWSLQWSHQDQVSAVSVHPLVTAVVSSRPGESCQCPPTGHCSGLIKTRWVLSVSTHWSLQWSHQDQVSAVSVHPLVTAVVSSRPGESCQCPPTGHCSGLIKTRWVLSVSTHWSLQWSHQDQVSAVSVHPLVTAVVSSRPGECCQCPPTGHCSGLIKTRWVLSVSTHWSLQWSHQDQVSPVSVHPLVTAVVSSRPGESCQCPPTGHCSGLIKTRWVLSVSTHWSLQWSQDQVSAVSVHPLDTPVVSSRPGECCQCPPTGHCSGLKTRWVLSVSTHWSLQWSHQDQVSAVSVHPLVTAVVSRPGECCQCPPTGHCSGLIKTRWVLSVSTHWSLQWSQDQVSPVSVHPLVTAVVSSRPGECCQCPPTGHCSGLIKTRWVLSVSTHWSLQWSQDQVSPVSVHPLVTAVVSSRPGESCQCPPTGHCSGLIKTRWVLSVSTHWSLQWSHQDQVSAVSVHPLVTAVVSRPGESCRCPPTGHCSGLSSPAVLRLSFCCRQIRVCSSCSGNELCLL